MKNVSLVSLVQSLVCVILWWTTWSFASNFKALKLPGLSVSLISSEAMNSLSKSFISSSISSSLSFCTVPNNVITWSIETLLSMKMFFSVVVYFSNFHKYTKINTFDQSEFKKMFVRIQKLIFSINANTNVMQVLVNIENPCALFFNKTKHIIEVYKHMNYVRKLSIFKPLCTRGSLMTQVTNLDIEKYLQCILRSNEILVIHKWSRKHSIKIALLKVKVLKVRKDVIFMFNFICWKLHLLEVTWHNDNKVAWKCFFRCKLINAASV